MALLAWNDAYGSGSDGDDDNVESSLIRQQQSDENSQFEISQSKSASPLKGKSNNVGLEERQVMEELLPAAAAARKLMSHRHSCPRHHPLCHHLRHRWKELLAQVETRVGHSPNYHH